MSPEETRLRDEFVQIILPWLEVAMNSAIPEPWEVSAHCAARAADAILTRLRGETDITALLSEVDRLRGDVDQHRARAERLAEALRFYASKYAWRSSTVYMCGHSGPSQAVLDGGQKALQALAQEGER